MLIIFFLVLQAMAAQNLPVFLDTASSQFISMQDVTKQMIEHDLVFVGEFHDHQAGHQMELELLQNFYTNSTTSNFALSLEMFERDVQFLVDGYTSNEIPESFFLDNSRPWGNYKTDYRPLVQYVKNTVPKPKVIASNIPRRFAALVADGNETVLWQMPATERSYYAPAIFAPHDRYYQIFYDMFKQQGWPDDKIERYYRAQCIKDDTMAMSIVEWVKNVTEPAKLISFTGSFHVDYKLGTYERVYNQLKDTKKMMLITIVAWNPKEPINPKDFTDIADIVIFAIENEELLE